MSALGSDMPVHSDDKHRDLRFRHNVDFFFVFFCVGTAFLSVVILVFLLGTVLATGLPYLDWKFLSSPPDASPSEAGIRPALVGSIWVCGVCALFALPLGVGTAIFMEEYRPRSRAMRLFHSIVQLNINNLAGVPSVVYGIVGLTAFGSMFGVFGTVNEPAFEMGAEYYDQFVTEGEQLLLVRVDGPDSPSTVPSADMAAVDPDGQPVEVNLIGWRARLPKDEAIVARTLRDDSEGGRITLQSWYYFRLPMDRGVLTGGLTLMLVVLPIIIIASQEALRAVPKSLREASLGMGATRWQTIQFVTLPASIPGIMTGSILAISRAIGEAAPVLIICGIVYIRFNPGNLLDDFSVMPLQIFNWARLPGDEFKVVAAKGIIVLLGVLLSFNTVAVIIRSRAQSKLS